MYLAMPLPPSIPRLRACRINPQLRTPFPDFYFQIFHGYTFSVFLSAIAFIQLCIPQNHETPISRSTTTDPIHLFMQIHYLLNKLSQFRCILYRVTNLRKSNQMAWRVSFRFCFANFVVASSSTGTSFIFLYTFLFSL